MKLGDVRDGEDSGLRASVVNEPRSVPEHCGLRPEVRRPRPAAGPGAINMSENMQTSVQFSIDSRRFFLPTISEEIIIHLD